MQIVIHGMELAHAVLVSALITTPVAVSCNISYKPLYLYGFKY